MPFVAEQLLARAPVVGLAALLQRVERARGRRGGVELIQPGVAERRQHHPASGEAAVDSELHGLEVAVVGRVGRVGEQARLRRAAGRSTRASVWSSARAERPSAPMSMNVNGIVIAATRVGIDFDPFVADALVDVGDASRQAADDLALEVAGELLRVRPLDVVVDFDRRRRPASSGTRPVPAGRRAGGCRSDRGTDSASGAMPTGFSRSASVSAELK